MDRLLDNPNMKNIKQSSVAAYIKDMISISGLRVLQEKRHIYLQLKYGKAELPKSYITVTDVFLCNSDLPPEYFNQERIGATLDKSINRPNTKKLPLPSYDITNGVITTPGESDILEIHYMASVADSGGFPLFPYDGSLMQAMENYVKYRYYTILGEVNKLPRGLAQEAHKEYMWYIGQYTTKSEMVSPDEAVAIANSYQRLIDSRTIDNTTDSLREYLKL